MAGTVDGDGRRENEPQAGGAFLAEASRLLAASLDYEETLATVAQMSLPYLGAWCIVDVCHDDEIRRAAIVHEDPAMQALARRLEESWPPERDDPLGVPQATRTRQVELIPEIPDETLVRVARSEENLNILRRLGMGSLLVVPLEARGDVLGAITYVSGVNDRSHGPEDVRLARDLAARCAMALDNARLHRSALAARDEAERALKEAEHANRAKTDFLRTISHELRTPLNAMGAYVELLELGVHGPLSERQREDLRRVRISQAHLHYLVEQVLEYAQLGAGGVRVEIRDVPLSAIVEDIAAVIGPIAEARDLELPLLEECLRPDIVVRADPRRTTQILVNLLSNAVKFTPNGGRVELACSVDDGRVEVRVSDNGPGIRPEDQERIFEPFVQVSHGLADSSSGTGLGLAITRELAHSMDGEVTVESEVGVGSCFCLRLPAGGEQNMES